MNQSLDQPINQSTDRSTNKRDLYATLFVAHDFQQVCHFQRAGPFGPVILYLLIKVYVMDEGAKSMWLCTARECGTDLSRTLQWQLYHNTAIHKLRLNAINTEFNSALESSSFYWYLQNYTGLDFHVQQMEVRSSRNSHIIPPWLFFLGFLFSETKYFIPFSHTHILVQNHWLRDPSGWVCPRSLYLTTETDFETLCYVRCRRWT